MLLRRCVPGRSHAAVEISQAGTPPRRRVTTTALRVARSTGTTTLLQASPSRIHAPPVCPGSQPTTTRRVRSQPNMLPLPASGERLRSRREVGRSAALRHLHCALHLPPAPLPPLSTTTSPTLCTSPHHPRRTTLSLPPRLRRWLGLADYGQRIEAKRQRRGPVHADLSVTDGVVTLRLTGRKRHAHERPGARRPLKRLNPFPSSRSNWTVRFRENRCVLVTATIRS